MYHYHFFALDAERNTIAEGNVQAANAMNAHMEAECACCDEGVEYDRIAIFPTLGTSFRGSATGAPVSLLPRIVRA